MPLSEFESETSAFGGQRSIQLSYRGVTVPDFAIRTCKSQIR